MIAARRLYLYLVSAVSLGLLLAGVVILLRVIADALGVAPAGIGGGQLAEQLSLGVALAAVGLPLWGVHTWYAERLAARLDESGAAERASSIRALYLSGGGAILLYLGATSAIGTIRQLLLVAIPRGALEPESNLDLATVGATAIVLLVAYGVLVRFRLRDLAHGPLRGPAAALGRLELYGAILIGLLVALASALSLASVALDLAIGPATADAQPWWRWQLADGVGGLLVGLAVWALHHRSADSLARRDDAIGAAERRSRTRTGEPAAFIVIAGGLAAYGLGGAVGALLAAWQGSGEATITAILDPLAGGLIYLGALTLRRADARREALAVGGPERHRSVVRLTDLAVAAVGLAFLAVGTARALGIGIDQLGEAPVSADPGWTENLLRSAAYALVGLPLWIWGWRPALARAAAAPDEEAGSTMRRAHLFLVSGLALVATATSGAFVLYQALRSVTGVEGGSVLGRTGDALGALVVAAIVLAYHASLVRSDGLRRAGARGVAPAAVPPLVPRFVVRGPAGIATDGLAGRLRASLPEGWTVEAVEAVDAGAREAPEAAAAAED